MGKSTERPRASAEPMNLNQSTELLKELLEIEKKRLDVAVRIEKDRNIVFPETTIIIRDIIKLDEAINGKRTVKEKKKPHGEGVDKLLNDFAGRKRKTTQR
jgi:hypothetical protein